MSHSYRFYPKLSLSLSFFFCLIVLSAQDQIMTEESFKEWSKIEHTQISNNGRWVVYEQTRERQDGQLKIYDTKKDKQLNFERAHNARLSEDSRYLAFFIYPSKDSIRALKRRKIKAKNFPGDTLLIYNLEKNNITRIPDVKSFELPQKWNNWIVYQLEVNNEQDTITSIIDSSLVIKLKKESKEAGSKLVFHQLKTGKEIVYPFVREYTLAKENPTVLFSSSGDDSAFSPGVYLFNGKRKKVQALFRHEGDYSQLQISENGQQAVFIADLDTSEVHIRPYQLFYYETDLHPEASLIVAPGDPFLPKGWGINANYKPSFAKDGSKMFFEIAPPPFLPDTNLLEEDKVKVEVWHYQDERLQTQQNVTLKKDRKKGFLSIWHTQTGNFQQLADKRLPRAKTANEGNSDWVIAYTESPYLKTMSWEGFPVAKDVYVMNTKTGRKQLVKSALRGSPNFSPEGKHVYWYNYPDGAWFSYSIAKNSILQLSDNNLHSFYNEEHDTPSFPNSYGIAGWSQNDDYIFIYDRYDIWKMDPKGLESPKKLTNGRKDETRYRYIKLDPEARFISNDEKLLLSTFNEINKRSGYAQLDLKKGKTKQIIEDVYRFNNRPLKARDSEHIVYTKENFQTFPDIWYYRGNINSSKRISRANPQQSKYKWGNIEPYNWKDDKGNTRSGMLVKPANFDIKQQYPMIVNFYERSSHELHQHRAPYPHRSTINYSFYANNGYLIFNPDIRYTTGSPGDNALQTVLSGVQSLIKTGFVDKDHIGLQGHSWGGYQIAHIVTKTDLFACAESGAPVVNMFSAYGGIRWGTGLSRMFQYEKTQSRIGGTIWDNPERYKANSPLFNLDKVTTPVLILHNDKDGAVPWYQGIEFFVAMRRLNKPAWLLNYNEEPHWPVKYQNRMDFQRRMLQFFDHYLKGEEMPEWMERGVKAVERGED